MNPIWLALACAHTPQEPMINLTEPPAVAAAPDYVPPVPTEHTLSNGVKVWVVEKPGLPLVSLRLVIPGGSASDPTEAWGTASLSDELLSSGAGTRNATEFAGEVERLALSLGSSTQASFSTVYLDAHTDRLTDGLALMADMILRPTFSDEDVDRAKTLRLGELAEASDDARTLAGWVMDKKYFGEQHPFGHPTEGTLKAVEALTAENLTASWKARYVPDHATIVVSGAVETAALLAQLETTLSSWVKAGVEAKTVPAPPLHTGEDRFYMVNKEGTSQTALQIIMPAPTGLDAASESAELGSIILGGTFTSRLNRLLREEKGYTYGARATYVGKPGYGYLLARTNVQKDVSAPALKDLIAELERYQGGIDKVELGKAIGSWQTSAVSSMESRSAIAGNFASVAAQGLPSSTLRDELDRAQEASIQSVNDAITASQLDNAVYVVVGDLAEIQEAVEAAVPVKWTVVDPLAN